MIVYMNIVIFIHNFMELYVYFFFNYILNKPLLSIKIKFIY